MSTIASTREAILAAFRGLPPDEQRAVADAVNLELQTAGAALGNASEPHPGQRGWVTWRQLAGLFANGEEPLSDEQVAQWIDEARLEKYGA